MLTRLLLTAVACSALPGVCGLPFASSVVAADQKLNWAEKMFSELSHDFGTVARGADVRHHIVITNLYEEDVVIQNVDTTCGCTAAKPDKTLLKTGDKALVEVQMDTKKFMRRKDSNVDVTLQFQGEQGASTRTVRVPITAYIRSDVVLTPGNVDFGAVEVGQPQEQRLSVAYAGREDWKIEQVQVPNSHIHVEAKETVRAGGKVEYELVITLDKQAQIGKLQDQITLITDDPNSPEVPVLVYAKVEPDITIAPAEYPLGNLKPGQVKPFQIVVKGKRDFTIESVECSKSKDCFEVMSLSEQSKSVHVVPFRMVVPEAAGAFEEELTFTIAGRPEPITCRVVGKITGGT
ncbi:MAG: DUF1573 domain-containing protein [Planctomycetaceae bacterium]|nr:DUF1573 domain-containing protein [Planctomycetaceae bacterium]